MFGFKKENNNHELVAVVDGKTVELDKVNDPVFSSLAMGDGIAIIPTNNIVVAPCDGKLSLVASTGHAFGIESKDGKEFMVHIGIDTVNLQGEGFKVLINQGEEVKKGQPIIEFDKDFISSKGIDLTTMLICLQADKDFIKSKCCAKEVRGGNDVVIVY